MPIACAMQETFLQRVTVGQLELFMVGLVAVTADNTTVTGAAADEYGFPVDRAFFELLERLSIFSARTGGKPLALRDREGRERGTRLPRQVFPSDRKSDVLRTSLSNGVALHASWPLACEAALRELIERDRVLRSFAGEFAPIELAAPDENLARALRSHYEIAAYSFGPKRTRLAHVATGMFLFPRDAAAPLAYGFGAAADVTSALAGAKREALQRLAFLSGEELPVKPPEPAPTPDYHQEYYLYSGHHAILREWLAGGRKRRRVGPQHDLLDGGALRYVDLTVEGIKGGLFVAKAASRKATVLQFGIEPARPRGSAVPHPIA
jgi:hypothetical protein